MLRNRMQWHQTRQKVLAENVANANTPGFRARDLRAPVFRPDGSLAASQSQGVPVERTSPLHLAGTASAETSEDRARTRFDAVPSGNAVSLEDEMQKSAANQMDFAAATSLYSRSLALLKTAIGKR